MDQLKTAILMLEEYTGQLDDAVETCRECGRPKYRQFLQHKALDHIRRAVIGIHKAMDLLEGKEEP